MLSSARSSRSFSDADDLDVKSLHCPIGHTIFEDPVIAADGHTYERSAIRYWLLNHETSPITNGILEHKRLESNHVVKQVIDELKGKGGTRAGGQGGASVRAGSKKHAIDLSVEESVVETGRFVYKVKTQSFTFKDPNSMSLACGVVRPGFCICAVERRSGNNGKFYVKLEHEEAWVLEDFLLPLHLHNALIVVQPLVNLALRIRPDPHECFMYGGFAGRRHVPDDPKQVIFCKKGELVSGCQYIIDGTRLYVRVEGRDLWICSTSLNDQGQYRSDKYLKIMDLVKHQSPLTFEIVRETGISLRCWPNHKYKVENSQRVTCGQVIKSAVTVNSPDGSVYVRIASSWLFVTKDGDEVMKRWDSKPEPFHTVPGDHIRLSLGDNGHEYLLIVTAPNNYGCYYQNIPGQMSRKIQKCLLGGREIVAGAFVAYTAEDWVLSGARRDGSKVHTWAGGGLEYELRSDQGSAIRSVSLSTEGAFYLCFENGSRYCDRVDHPDEIDRLYNYQKKFHVDILDHGAGYFCSFSDNWEARVQNRNILRELQKMDRPKQVATTGTGEFVILGARGFCCSTGISDELSTDLKKVYAKLRNASRGRLAVIRNYENAVLGVECRPEYPIANVLTDNRLRTFQ